MLRGYMTPYGTAGFGPNPYDPYGSAFYGGYNPYDPYGSNMGWNNGWSNSWGSPSGWGMNPYMGYGFGSGFGYNPYAYNPYGCNNGWGGGYNVDQGSGWLGGGEPSGGTPIVVAPRTPIWASSSINSATGGGRLMTNKMDAGVPQHSGAAQPRVFWRTVSDAAETIEGSWEDNRPAPATPQAARRRRANPRVLASPVGLLPLHGVQAPGRRDRGLPIRAATGRKPAQAPQAGHPAEAKAPGAAVGQEVVAVHPDAERT